MSVADEAVRVIDHWCSSLRKYQDQLPAKGSIATALHVLGRLRVDYRLDITAHVADGEAQITGLSTRAVKTILAEFGETRALSAVGGRSNRGTRRVASSLLSAIRPLNLEELDQATRDQVLRAMQQHIVTNYVSQFFAAQRVKALFDPSTTSSRFIDAILENARSSGKAGPVAEYLVGAKLACRFPNIPIRNKRFSTSDAQAGLAGDFEIGDTVFHVTMSPMPELFEKLKGNLEQGHRIYVLVPRDHLVGAQQNAGLIAAGRIAVESIESFVGTNIDELCEFDGAKLKSGFRCLLDKYNERVDAVELDKSMLIDIPANLE